MIEAAGRWDCGNRVVLCGGVFRDRRVLVLSLIHISHTEAANKGDPEIGKMTGAR